MYDISDHVIGALEYEILAELNAHREENGLPPLSMDSTLCALAAIRAYETTVSFSHTRPDGRDCFSVLDDYGYTGWQIVGENLLYGTNSFTAAQMVSSWMFSEGHRANILNEAYTLAGIGIYYTNGYIYVANFFAG